MSLTPQADNTRNNHHNAIQVGLIGFGNVGKGVFDILKGQAAALEERVGRSIKIKTIVVRDVSKYNGIDFGKSQLSSDVSAMLADPDISIVVEVMGGEYPAYDFICEALKNKKYVVTANKDVVAKHKNIFVKLAKKHGVDIYFEASVGGGIPIIRAFKVGYSANRIHSIIGILNGTTNYILTKMKEANMSFTDALTQAQLAGFAEADPSSDVSGLDAAYKLVILTFVAFKLDVSIKDISYKGIDEIDLIDISYAESLGYSIRLIAQANLDESNQLLLRVEPMLVPNTHPLSQVKNEFNAIFSDGHAMGESMIYGKGAGSFPTGSAVVSDLVDIAFDLSIGKTGKRNLEEVSHKAVFRQKENVEDAYYIRLLVKDELGVLEKITHVLSQFNISIANILQKTQNNDQVHLLLVTHKSKALNIKTAIQAVSDLKACLNCQQVLLCF